MAKKKPVGKKYPTGKPADAGVPMTKTVREKVKKKKGSKQ